MLASKRKAPTTALTAPSITFIGEPEPARSGELGPGVGEETGGGELGPGDGRDNGGGTLGLGDDGGLL